jgi:hypothetical protein
MDLECIIKDLSRLLYCGDSKAVVKLGHFQITVKKWSKGKIDATISLIDDKNHIIDNDWTHYQKDFFE